MAPVFYFPLVGTPTAEGNQLSFYEAGSNTALNVWTDTDLSIAWNQPIILNAAGESDGPIYVSDSPAYKVVYTDANGVAIPGYPVDGVSPSTIINVMTTATVTLTNAQIKALPTTAITLVDAPSSGLWIKPFGATMRLTSTAGAYTNMNTTYSTVAIQSSAGAWLVDPLVNDSTTSPTLTQVSGVFGNAHNVLVPFRVPFGTPQGGNNGYLVTDTHDYSGNLVTGVNGLAVVLAIDNNGSGDLTGGNAANSMTIVVYYSLESLA